MMKKNRNWTTKILLALFFMCSAQTLCAYDFEVNGIYYNADNESQTASVVSGELSYSGVVNIPEQIEHDGIIYTVTAIGDWAFARCNDLTEVNVSNSVMSIGEYAFGENYSLAKVTIGDGVTSIGYGTFRYCTSLAEVTIGNSVASIGNAAFQYCASLTELTIPSSVTFIDEYAFDGTHDIVSITSYINTPFVIYNAFNDAAYDNVILYVPAESFDLYKTTEGWSSFKNILPIGFVGNIDATNFPDEKFRNYLLEQDYGADGMLTEDEIAGITRIEVSSRDISSLKGIEFFTALEHLYCPNNQLTDLDVSNNAALTHLFCDVNPLTALDVSNNTALTYLSCSSNQLTSLDVSKNTALTYLSCGNPLKVLDVSNNTALEHLQCESSQLTTLDVSKNTALTLLYCSNNQLTALDISNNTALKSLYCYSNQLTELNVSNNTALTSLYCYSNQLTELNVLNNTTLTYLECYNNQIKGDAMDALINSLPENTIGLECILRVYNEGGADGNVCDKDQVADAKAKGWTPYYYSSTEGDWREYEGSVLAINEENFPDENFRNYLLEQDYGADGGLTRAEIRGITYINVSSRNIGSLKGIEYFTALEVLYCNHNQLTALDVSSNMALTYLDCAQNQLTTLDISKNTVLETFYCYSNQLTELNVSSNTELTGLYCNDNQLTALDVSKNTALIHLVCYNNQLTELNVSSNTALTDLHCNDNQLAALDVSNNLALIELSCSSNQLTALDVSRNTALTQLWCDYNQLTELNVSNNTALADLHCNDNQLTVLDVSNNPALNGLDCSHNQLTNLDVSNNTALIVLDCYRNHIKDEAMDTLINSLPENTTDEEHILRVYGEAWSDENVCDKDQVAAVKAKGWTPYYYSATERDWREYEGSFIAIDEVNFPDANFRAYLLEQDYGEDGVLTNTEIRRITHIDVSGRNISSLKGMSYFTALTILYCYSNQIKSEAMNVLVGDLPKNLTESEHVLRVHAGNASNEGNVITRSQVVAAKVKGWIPYYSLGGQEWQGYRTPPAPTLTYNGRSIRLSTTEDGAKIYYTIDGTSPIDDLGSIGKTTTEYGGEFNVGGLCQVRAVTVVDMQNVSEDAVFEIDYLFDGSTVYVRQGNMLAKAFKWCGGMDAIERLSVKGSLSYDDISLLAKASSLVHLDLSNATLTSGRLPDDAFNGAGLVSFVSPHDLSNAGGSLFANCRQLAAVVWNVDIALSDNTFNGVDNPNLLLYVNNAGYAPSSVPNVIVNGMIESIVLTDKATGNNNFYCPQAFTVDNISYTRDFKMQTEVGVCRGWETLTLPFTVQRITHERNGLLQPFTADGDGKPFWLLQMSSSGLESATEIVANQPYLISMPNSKYYLDAYKQNGQVTFAASHVTIEPTEQNGLSGQGVMLVPALQSVAKSAQVYAINRNAAYDAYVEGSVFVPNYREVRPFEAYTQHPASGRTLITLSDLMNGSTTALLDLPLKSEASDVVKVYTLSGVLVAMGQRSEVMKRLHKGVYIINERKIIIK